MKNYIFFLLLYTALTSRMYAALEWEALKNAIIPNPSTVTAGTTTLEGQWFLDFIFEFLRDSTFALMAVIAIGVFLFIWGRLVVARGNPEEFKKAMLSFVYAAVGIFIVAAAWAMVRLIAGLDI